MWNDLGGETVPNLKNAIKAVSVSNKKKESNNVFKASMRTAIKNVDRAVAANDKAKAEENLKIAIKRIDKAVSKGVTHINAAGRYKSRLTTKVNEMK